ncbi:outer membrane protein [Pelagibacterium xiamenense]|uniref:outer membrane protein n=1 Tax=Pelagibacterium xiamenense TaxID=2901140 RepID=UPI001E5272FE|nr:outer membrane beta-barrel protein [Pelagibacterium xiamenense]MCD7060897.1 outer membrane beta-barrel protein [Pelagibacterium xiamenense]
MDAAAGPGSPVSGPHRIRDFGGQMTCSGKPFIVAAAAVLIVSGAGKAADPIVSTPMTPAMPTFEDASDWSGFYMGVGGTASWQSYEFDGDAGAGEPDFSFYPTVYGGQLVVGGNVQFDSVVFGIEAAGGVYGFSGSGSGDLSELFDGAPDDVDFDYTSGGYSADLSARLGYLVTPSMLIYGSGGARAIYSNNDTAFTYEDPVSGDDVTEELEHFGNLFGTVGAGVEVALSDDVSVDLEYEYGFSAAGWLAEEIPELDGLSAGSHTISAQVLFHF